MSALPSPTTSDARPQLIRFGRETCGQLDQAERREWWLTNGRGAYAAGTLAGSLTRRYHGLLVAPVSPPLGRVLACVKADATLIDGESEWPLFTNHWSDGAVDPTGLAHIESFQLDGRIPTWRYAIGDMRIEQRIWLEQDADRVWIGWRLLTRHRDREPRLRIDLLVDARDHHNVTQAGQIQPELALDGERLRVIHPDWFELGITAIGGTLSRDPAWIRSFDLPIERERGLEDREDHLRVGQAELSLETGRWVGVTAAIGPQPSTTPDVETSLRHQLARDAGLIDRARSASPLFERAPDWVRQLLLAADSFIFARPLDGVPDGESVIAGYPWFGDWGRDTMIALPGLTLATGRFESARRILETFARFVDGGMLPNVFPGSGETPEYNTVDAALWYLEAWRAYLETTGDLSSLERVFPTLESIVRAYRDGTRFDIGMDPEDGLIRAGKPGVQLTWMDAKVDDWVVTPRIGKPVEINALWYNGLVAMREFAARLGRDSTPYAQLAERSSIGFRRYLRPDGHGLFDRLDGSNGQDASVRPNQIFAVSLPASPLTPEQQASVVAVCGRELLTSFGLRSLAPSHPHYQGRYLGDRWARDGAYHQGTVWGWLLGHYALAEFRVTSDTELALSRLEPMANHLHDAGLGSISEIFDGDPPHTPRGTPLQAWSVACTLEAWWRLTRARTERVG